MQIPITDPVVKGTTFEALGSNIEQYEFQIFSEQTLNILSQRLDITQA